MIQPIAPTHSQRPSCPASVRPTIVVPPLRSLLPRNRNRQIVTAPQSANSLPFIRKVFSANSVSQEDLVTLISYRIAELVTTSDRRRVKKTGMLTLLREYVARMKKPDGKREEKLRDASLKKLRNLVGSIARQNMNTAVFVVTVEKIVNDDIGLRDAMMRALREDPRDKKVASVLARHGKEEAEEATKKKELANERGEHYSPDPKMAHRFIRDVMQKLYGDPLPEPPEIDFE